MRGENEVGEGREKPSTNPPAVRSKIWGGILDFIGGNNQQGTPRKERL